MADIGPSQGRGQVNSDFVYGASQRAHYSTLARVTANANASTSGTAYWVYVGYIQIDKLFQGISMQQTGQATTVQTAEYALASTPVAPMRAGQILTKLVATSSVSDMLAGATSVVRPLAGLNTVVPAGTHLWCGFRQAMNTTQALFEGLFEDMGQGALLVTAAAGVLTASATFVGSVPAFAAGVSQAPYMIATMD